MKEWELKEKAWQVLIGLAGEGLKENKQRLVYLC